MKKIILASAIFISSQLLHAGATPVTKIDKIYAYNGFIVVKIKNPLNNTSNCTHTNAKTYLGLRTGQTYGKELYSALLTAYTTGAKVRLGHAGCTPWGGTIPKIYRIEMIK